MYVCLKQKTHDTNKQALFLGLGCCVCVFLATRSVMQSDLVPAISGRRCCERAFLRRWPVANRVVDATQ